MLRGRREVIRLPFPGSEDENPPEIGVRILLEDEIDAARIEAMQFIKSKADKLKMSASEMLSIDAELLDREIERQLIYRAILNPDPEEGKDYEPFFASPQAVRQLDSVLLRSLFHVYDNHQQYVSGGDVRAVRCAFAQDIGAYFGCPASQCTDWQVIYWFEGRNAFLESSNKG